MSTTDFADRYGPAALVTGASSGIGKAFAELLASKGVDVVVVARRAPRLDELAARLETQYGVTVKICPVDLSDATAAQEILEATASLDIGLVVSNAGFGLKGPLENGEPKAMADMVMVNCTTPMLLTHGFIPRLRKRGKGGLILTSSVEGLMGCPYSTAYSASKGFVNNLGEGLWGELTSDGIDVLTLCPGATESEAAGLQGIDITTLKNVMSAEDVVQLTLENIRNGPVYFPSAYYKASFDHLLALPRRDALLAMAQGMKK